MSMTRAELELVLTNDGAQIIGGAIQKVFEQDRETVVFRIRARGETNHLLLSVRPSFTRMYLVSGKPQQPDHPSAFTMQLRKWLEGARIESIELMDGDRIVRMTCDVRDPESEEESPARRQPQLVVELTGQHGCAYLLDEDGEIIGQSHRYRGLTERHPGDVWTAPETAFAPAGEVRPELQQRTPEESPSSILEPYFDDTIAESERTDALSNLRSRLKREAKRLKRRLKAVEDDLSRAENADEFKRRAELLQGAYNQEIPRGATSVVVKDYWDPEMNETEIELEPRLTLQENIDKAFHQYRRLSEATERIESRLLETMELIDAVASARGDIHDDMELGEIRDTEQSLTRSGVLPRKKKRTSDRAEGRVPYRQYRAKSGATILVGRNSKANDELTTKVARGRDVWLHARDWPGSHVVLRMNKGDEPRSDDLVDAAILAAHFSRGSSDSLIDVIWTRAKHVRKPKGAAPGLVTHSGGSNIAVRRDPERLERLLATVQHQ